MKTIDESYTPNGTNNEHKVLYRAQVRSKGERLKNVAGDPMPSWWVYGGLAHTYGIDTRTIIYQREPELDKFSVKAETVCQYTCKKDIVGRLIFDNDIVHITREDGTATYLKVEMKEVTNIGEEKLSFYGWCLVSPSGDYFVSLTDIIIKKFYVAVAGNIFDDADLIGLK